MTLDELIRTFRSDVVDTAAPFLWTRDEIVEYINDAQVMFCRLTDGIADSTSEITTITLVAGEAWHDYDERILQIRFAQRLDDYKEIDLLNVNNLSPSKLQTDYGISKPLKLDDTTGQVRAVVLGMQANQVRSVPIPEIDVDLAITVDRLPLETMSRGSDVPEVATHHHIHLLMWAKHRAYMKQDAETFDKSRADDFEQKFINYCGQSKAERDKRKHTPRLIQYGGL